MATKKKVRQAKPTVEEKRIYVILPEKVTAHHLLLKEDVTIPLSAGRLMAQAAHVTGLMRGHEYNWYGAGDYILLFPITAINLGVRNSRELDFIQHLLQENSAQYGGRGDYRVYEFYDKNADFYGTTVGVKTAICTSPIERSVVEAVLGHLELYGS